MRRSLALLAPCILACSSSSTSAPDAAVEPATHAPISRELLAERPSAGKKALLPLERVSDRQYRLAGRTGSARFDHHGFSVGAGKAALSCEADQRLTGPTVDEVGAPMRRLRGAEVLETANRLAWRDGDDGAAMVVEPSAHGFDYRFVIQEGGSLDVATLRCTGASSVRATASGDALEIDVDGTTARVSGLHAFAVEGSARRELPARFDVERLADGTHRIRTRVDGWSGRSPLIIDPTVTWGSYLGGSGDESFPVRVGVDSSNAVYVTGKTTSADFPSATGTFSNSEVFVAKLTATGTLAWAEYLGGSGFEELGGLAVTPAGDVFVVGNTSSTNFPTTAGLVGTLKGSTDAFVTKLNPSNGAIVWSTLFGGSKGEMANAVTVGPTGGVVVTGTTSSTDMPATTGLDTSLGNPGSISGQDAFVASFDSAGNRTWSTYLGGDNSDDTGNAIAQDSTGTIFVGGTTLASDFPKTAGNAPSGIDGFVVKYGSDGKVTWARVYGGSGTENLNALTLDGAGGVLVGGNTDSTDFPGASSPSTTTTEAFVSRIAGTDGTLSWSHLFAGAGDDRTNVVQLSGTGVFVGGATSSANFPVKGAFSSTLGGPLDGWLARMDLSGNAVWASYFGSSDSDQINSLAIDGQSQLVVAGATKSTTGIATAGAYDTTFGGASDGFVVKIAQADLGAACTANANCKGSVCADGVCCDRACAGCEACTAALKGSGSTGTCGSIAAGSDPHSVCAPSSPPCGPDGQCDGTGKCRAFAPTSTTCVAQSCSGATQSNARFCDGAGTCAAGTTTACAAGYVCSGTSCAATCTTDAQCASTHYCNGSTCVPKKGNGTTCAAGHECTSGNCPDQDKVCCDLACNGACEACSATKKGSGVDGACGAIPDGADPDSECPDAPMYSCVDLVKGIGVCDGARACRKYAKAGTACAASSTCSAGVQTGKACDGSGNCKDGSVVNCAPYRCADATACASKCAKDDDCIDTTYYCSTVGICEKKKSNGTACTAATECSSMFCADGVCCDNACDGQCASCSEPGSMGTCVAVTGVPHGTHPACAGTGTCAGSCDGTNKAACAYPVIECDAKCGAGTEAISRCDGAGACKSEVPRSCNGYTCDGSTRCRTSCSTDVDCADGYTCESGKCTPKGTKCGVDGTTVIDSNGQEKSCGVYLCRGGKCVETCTTTADDCAAGYVCDTGKCIPATTPEDTSSGGCGCRVGARDERACGLAGLALIALVIARRRRSVC